MQPLARPIDVNAPCSHSSQPRWSGRKPKVRPAVTAMDKLKIWAAKLLLMAVLLLLFSGCVSLVYYEGNYHGKVIDSETLQPIEGAVVMAVWSKMYGTAGGPVYKYYDARETLTDRNGEFSIRGMGPRAMTHLQKMDIVIFKAGYDYLDRSTWEELKKDERILWEGEKAIVPLKKISMEQRSKRFVPYIDGDVPMEKQELFRKEIKKEINEIYQ